MRSSSHRFGALVDVGVERMEAFMQERTRSYGETAKRLGLAK